MALALIDTDTGETIRTVEMDEGDSIRLIHSKSQTDCCDSFPFSSFIKLNGEELKYLSLELPKEQLSFIISLLPYLSYRDNCLKDSTGSPLSVANIAGNVNISLPTVYRLIDKLIEADLLCRAKNSSEYQLYVNPWFAGKGNRCNRVLQSMFRNYRIRSMGGKKWKQVAKLN